MPAPKGNEFWKRRAKHGREADFTPDQLWEDAIGYFEWVRDNPLECAEPITYKGGGSTFNVPKMRAMTASGLCLYLGISFQTWSVYCKREEYRDVTTRVQQILYTQKFEGAAAGLLNPNIIARDLGLADKSELSGPNGGPVQVEETGDVDRQFARRLAVALIQAVQGGQGDSGQARAIDHAHEVGAESGSPD